MACYEKNDIMKISKYSLDLSQNALKRDSESLGFMVL